MHPHPCPRATTPMPITPHNNSQGRHLGIQYSMHTPGTHHTLSNNSTDNQVAGSLARQLADNWVSKDFEMTDVLSTSHCVGPLLLWAKLLHLKLQMLLPETSWLLSLANLWTLMQSHQVKTACLSRDEGFFWSSRIASRSLSRDSLEMVMFRNTGQVVKMPAASNPRMHQWCVCASYLSTGVKLLSKWWPDSRGKWYSIQRMSNYCEHGQVSIGWFSVMMRSLGSNH